MLCSFYDDDEDDSETGGDDDDDDIDFFKESPIDEKGTYQQPHPTNVNYQEEFQKISSGNKFNLSEKRMCKIAGFNQSSKKRELSIVGAPVTPTQI